MDVRSSEMLKAFSGSSGTPSMPKPLKKFYCGEPMALGITQIFTGIIGIAFGIVIELSSYHSFYDLQLLTPYWSGILYIISGSLSVAAAKKPKMPLVKGSLAMNTVSAVAAGIVMVISSISLVFQSPPGTAYSGCGFNVNDTVIIRSCHESRTIPYAIMHNMVAFLLTLTVLEFLIAIITSAFGCAAVCRNATSETTIVIFQHTAEANPPPPPGP